MEQNIKSYFIKSLWSGIIILAVRCFFSMPEGLYDIYGCIGEVISITVVMMGVYEKWVWKFNRFESMPVLSKVYKGTIKSDYDGKDRNATLYIKQSLLTINIILQTDESKSKTISSSIEDILGEYQLTYSYINTPKIEVRNRSEIHFGTAMLCVDNPDELTGHYFTDRESRGDMIFKAIKKQ